MLVLLPRHLTGRIVRLLESLYGCFVRLNVILVLLIVTLMPRLLQHLRVHRCNLPGKLDSDLLCLARELVVRPFFEVVDLDSSAAVSTGVLGMLTDVLPGKVGPQTVNLATVVSDEEDEVFGREVAGASSVGEGAGLQNLCVV